MIIKKHQNVCDIFEEKYLQGKGMAKTFWLIGKDQFKKDLPDPPPLSTYVFSYFLIFIPKNKCSRRTGPFPISLLA
jgi:hypothetical protein